MAIGAFDSLFHTLTLLPGALLLLRTDESLASLSVFRLLVPCTVALGVLAGICWLPERSWAWVDEVWGFELFVRDLKPNLGIFWYLFTEMFAEFETFYLLVLQLFVFLFAAPFTIRLARHPMLLFWVLVANLCAWRAYPSVGDLACSLALVPLLLSVVRELRYSFIIFVAWIFVGILAPIFWTLWVTVGSG